MNRALLRKEWAQARLNVLGMLAVLCGLWLLVIEDRYLLPEPYRDQSITLLAGLVVFAGLQLALAQFASESLWKTRDLLVFRACGPASAFRAKCLVGAAATTLFACGPVLVWSVWQYFNSPLATAGTWSRVIAYAQVGTLAWAGWGVGALCSQLRHGWGTRVVVLLIAGSGLLGLAAQASKPLAGAPLWADWLFPMGSVVLGIGLAWCAGRAFSAGVDEDVPLRDRHGLALAFGVVVAMGFPLAVVSSAVTDHLAGKLRSLFAHVIETPEGELELARLDGRVLVPVGAERDDYSDDSMLVRVFDPDWMGWGWPEPEERVDPAPRGQAFGLGGSWTHLSGVNRREGGLSTASVLYESRSRSVHLFVKDPEAPRHEVLDAGFSVNTLIVWFSEDGWQTSGRVLADLERNTLARVSVDGGSVSLEPLELPGGDEFRGVERVVTRAWAEVGYRAPFAFEYGLLIVGERDLYRLSKGVLEPYERVGDEPFTAAYSAGYWKWGIAVPGPNEDAWIAASDADRLVRLRSRYARYDGLDPTIEVLDAKSGASLFIGRLAPGAESLKAAACAASLLQTPIGSIASFANREPWRGDSMFDNPALLGGRRPWLLAACLAFAAYLAWRVRRETSAWGRSPRLGAFWVAVTLCLGLVGWVLFRITEPRPARAEGRAARRAPAGVRTELVASGARL